ncbi:MAG TPA: hypothetical protein VH186_14685 [Chloroflexia bacterium]|nr:hypothetical protein [Chloroflexia bacterium]
MPSYNSAARNYSYPEYDEDLEQAPPVRRPAPGTPPAYRVAGGSLTRQKAPMPQPLPGNGPRRSVNVPAALPRGYGEEATRRVQTRPAPGRRPASNGNPLSRLNIQANGSTMRLALLGAGVIAVLIVSYLVVSFAVHTWQVWQDDMTYGRPRITRLEANVGHNETDGNKTLFVAQNIKGQISITEYPGGDPTKTRVIVGPQLFGKDKELVPVKLSVKDVNADGQPDLLANVEDQQLIYINENGNFRPINDQERAKLKALGKDGQ